MSSTAVEQDNRPAASQRTPQDLYRLLMLRKSGSELLVASERPPFTLPCVEIPVWERVAENLTESIRKRYGISTICLFAPESSGATTDGARPLYQVMETREGGTAVPDEMRWLTLDSIALQCFADERDRLAITDMLRQIAGFQSGEAIGPFGRPGWIEELFSWVQHETDAYGLRLTGSFHQLNASPTFSLIRLETNAQAVWFKAVGQPNLREFEISLALAKLFPGFVPTLIAPHPTWHGWLAMEFTGSTLDKIPDSYAWVQAARVLAELQIASAAKTDQLLATGCHDLGVSSLLTTVDPFIEVMSELMEYQQQTPPRILGRTALVTLGRQIKDALSALAELNIPDTLGHLDFNPGNILCSGTHCVFLDWAEACVGQPFLTLQYLSEHLARLRPEDRSLVAEVARAYETEWQSVLAPETISAAQELAPVLTVFAYAVGTSAWRDPAVLRETRSAAFLRSLTRRVYVEMEQLRIRRRICLS